MKTDRLSKIGKNRQVATVLKNEFQENKTIPTVPKFFVMRTI